MTIIIIDSNNKRHSTLVPNQAQLEILIQMLDINNIDWEYQS